MWSQVGLRKQPAAAVRCVPCWSSALQSTRCQKSGTLSILTCISFHHHRSPVWSGGVWGVGSFPAPGLSLGHPQATGTRDLGLRDTAGPEVSTQRAFPQPPAAPPLQGAVRARARGWGTPRLPGPSALVPDLVRHCPETWTVRTGFYTPEVFFD